MKKYFLTLLILIGFVGMVFASAELSNLRSESEITQNKFFEVNLNQTVQYEDLKLKFTEIEDSRCPLDVMCVWEGNAKITLQVFSQTKTQSIIFITDKVKTVNFELYEINLVDISPHPTTTTEDIRDKYVVTLNISKKDNENILSPLKQINSGIALKDLKCDEGKKIIYKYNRLRAACVSEISSEKLVQRGWALSKNERANVEELIVENRNHKDQIKNFNFNITPKIINGQKYLTFEGSGWNYFHDIDITITKNLEKITSIKTKTNNDGMFYLTWIVPSDFQSGQYNILATDGRDQKELETTIVGAASNKVDAIGSGFVVKVDGENQVRRGTTHDIEVHVYRDKIPVEGARIFLTIEDYGEDIIREFKGRTNQNGYFVYSWEIPKKFDDIETLLVFVGVTDGNSSRTEIFKFNVYCLPGEKGCKIDGN